MTFSQANIKSVSILPDPFQLSEQSFSVWCLLASMNHCEKTYASLLHAFVFPSSVNPRGFSLRPFHWGGGLCFYLSDLLLNSLKSLGGVLPFSIGSSPLARIEDA
jgi:hypothetical protein